MKASELIAQLQKVLDEHGDINVLSGYYGSGYAEFVEVIEGYDDEHDYKPYSEILIK